MSITVGSSFDGAGNYIGNQAGQWTSVSLNLGVSNIIHCSDSVGNDAWDGSAPNFVSGTQGPVKTLIKAVGGVGPGATSTGLGTLGAGNGFGFRNGQPDVIMLRGGDTWNGQCLERAVTAGSSDNFPFGGSSVTTPAVIAACDPSNPTVPNPGTVARATINVPGGTVAFGAGDSTKIARNGVQLQGAVSGYLAFLGLHFTSTQRNPGSGDYVGVGNVGDCCAIFKPGPPQPALGANNLIVIEDCQFDWLSEGISIAGANHVTVRRCTFQHLWSPSTTTGTQGMAMGEGDYLSDFMLEENIFDQCGTFPNTVGGNNRGRNAYIQWQTFPFTAQGNISSRSASEAMQFRGDPKIVRDNCFSEGSAVDIGHNEGMPTTVSAEFSNNTLINMRAILGSDGTETGPGGTPQGIGFNFLNCSGSSVYVHDNIMANVEQVSASNSAAIVTDAYNGKLGFLSIRTAGSLGTPGTYQFTVTGGHGTGGQIQVVILVSGSADTTPFETLVSSYATDNGQYVAGDVVSGSPGGITGLTVNVDTVFSQGVHGVRCVNNIVFNQHDYKADAGGVNDPHGGAINDFSGNAVDVAGANTFNYPDPHRSIATYAGSLGLTASVDGFMNAAIPKSRMTWDSHLTGHALNTYIRAGFGLGSLGHKNLKGDF